MSAPKIYRFDDDNAPILNGLAGTLNALLLACLVDGYGNQEGAGWTAQYVATDKSIIALRNSAQNGTGFFLQVADSTTTAMVQGYEAMSDLDAGAGPFYSAAQTVHKSTAANDSARRWILLATDTFFHFFAYVAAPVESSLDFSASISNNAALATFCFGDLIRTNDEGFASVLGLGTMDYSGINVNVYGLLGQTMICGSAGNAYISAPRPLAATPNTPTALSWVRGGGPFYWTSGTSGATRPVGPAYGPGQLFLSRPCLVDGASVNMRGFLPGWYHPCHGWEEFAALGLATISEGGRNFLSLPYSRYRAATVGTSMNILIDLGDWS